MNRKRIRLVLTAICLLALLIGACTGPAQTTKPAPTTPAQTTTAAPKPSETTLAGPSTTAAPTTTTAPKPKLTPEEVLEEGLKNGTLIKPDPKIKWPLSEQQITLKIMKPFVTYDINYGDMHMLKDYEKKTNIKIEWDLPPSANFRDKFTQAMNTGRYPDAIIAAVDVEKYAQQGIFIDLIPLLSEMPNLSAHFADKFKEEKRQLLTDDGKLYSFPTIREQISGNNVLLTRKDLLDKHKLKLPETIDDWYTVLTTFKEKENMMPLSGFGAGGTGMLALVNFAPAWGVAPSTGPSMPGFYLADKYYPYDKKVHFGPLQPRYKEMVTWLNKLWTEKLIDPEIVSNDRNAFQAKALQGKVGVWRGYLNADMIVLNTAAEKEGKKTSEYQIREMPVLKGPYGDQLLPWVDPSASANSMVVSKTNKYPKETAKWVDFWYGPVGRTYVYGVEDVTYTLVNGQPMWTDWVINNPNQTMNEARGKVTFGRSTWPCLSAPWALTAATGPAYVEEDRIKFRKPEYLVPLLPNGLSFTPDETSYNSKTMTDVQTFINENVTKFINGERPLAEWDAFTAQLKGMGVEKVLQHYQNSVDRYAKR